MEEFDAFRALHEGLVTALLTSTAPIGTQPLVSPWRA